MKTPATFTATDRFESFVATKTRIDEMLSRLVELSDDCFYADPDNITWNDIVTADQTATELQAITDRIFKEGEHAAA